MLTDQNPVTGSGGPAPVATINRRHLLRIAFAASTTMLVAACSGPTTSTSTGSAIAAPSNAASSVAPAVATPGSATTGPGQTQTLAPTVSSVDVGEVTPALTEGPYFKPNSPERASLIDPGMAGTRLTLTGKVLSTHAQPIAKALLDFWQADNAGGYDNSGYTLRGHQFTNADGQYQLVAVVPGLYPGRTRHLHVKVQAPNQPALTTQLFFPNEPQNSSDGIFSPKLVLPLKDAPDGSKVATFNFVLNVG